MNIIKNKKILVSVAIGRGVKNFLITDAYRMLQQNNKILICGDITSQPDFIKTFSDKNVEFKSNILEGTKNSQAKLLSLFTVVSTVSDCILAKGNMPAKVRLLKSTFSTINLLYILPIFLLSLLYCLTKNVKVIRYSWKKLLTIGNPVTNLLEEWSPDLTILLTPTYPQDAITGAASNLLGIKTVLIPSSWDNVLINKESLFDPDLVLSWSDNMSKLGRNNWIRGGGQISAIGQIQFDEYYKHVPRSRYQFLKEVGLPTNPTRIVTYIVATDGAIGKQKEALKEICEATLSKDENSLIIRHISDKATSQNLMRSTGNDSRVGNSFPHPAYSGNLESYYIDKDPVQDYFDLLYHSDIFIASAPTMLMLEAAFFGKHTILADFDKKYEGMGSKIINSWMKAMSLDNDAVKVVHISKYIAQTIENAINKNTYDVSFETLKTAWDVPGNRRSDKAINEIYEMFK